MLRSNIYLDLPELLIKPTERIDFIYKFILISSISDLILVYLCQLAIPFIYNENNLINSTIGTLIIGVITGLAIGIINGTLQWLILHKYLIREWIIAISISNIFYGICVAMIFLQEIHNHNLLRDNFDFNLVWFVVTNLQYLCLSIASSLALGLLQMLVFRTYLKNINWWLYFPLLTGFISGFQFLPIAIILWLFKKKSLNKIENFFYFLLIIKAIAFMIYLSATLGLDRISFWFDTSNQIVFNTVNIINSIYSWLVYGNLYDYDSFWFSWLSTIFIFTGIQALGFCFLRLQKNTNLLHLNSTSLFANTLDIDDYFKIRAIEKKIYARINHLWQDNLNLNLRLTYWLVVRSDASILACYPLNQISQDRFSSIPLARLIDSSQHLQKESVEKTAKLEVNFLPPGLLEIKSLSGIPLFLIGIFLFIAIMAVSFIVRFILLRI